jgi:hypothetical protein
MALVSKKKKKNDQRWYVKAKNKNMAAAAA